jgi:hypothetical protein
MDATKHHVLRLAYDPGCEGCADGDPDEACDPRCFKVAVECPGVTPGCEMWMPCSHDHGPMIRDEDLDEANYSGKLMGEPHMVIDSCWMVPKGKCFVALADCLQDAVQDLDVEPGVYAIDHEMDGEQTSFSLSVIAHLTPVEVTP